MQFPVGTRAAVTLGKGLTKDKLTQSCMRMRLLGCGHTLAFFAAFEVAKEIEKLSKLQQTSSVVGKVLAWTFHNSQEQVRDGFVNWAHQGIKEIQKLNAYQIYSNSSDRIGSLESYSDQLIETDDATLNELYGSCHDRCLLSDLVEKRCENCSHSLQLFKEGLKTRCEVYASSKEISANILDEEQERELEHEQERENQVIRPRRMTPRDPNVPDCVKKLVSDEQFSKPDFITLRDCLKSTTIWKTFLSDSKLGLCIFGDGTRIIASPEFAEVLTDFS